MSPDPKKPLFLLELETIEPLRVLSPLTVMDCTNNHDEGVYKLLEHIDALIGDNSDAGISGSSDIRVGARLNDGAIGTGLSSSDQLPQSGSGQVQTHVVILVHGIRDFAL
jgi:hypothetical protein